MQKLVYTNPNGDEIDLTDSVNFGITEWVGFSEVENDVQSQTAPFQDGAVYLDSVLHERDMSVTVCLNDGGDLKKRYELKRKMIHTLNPKLGEGELVYTNDYLSKKIKVVPNVPVFPTKNMNNSGTLKSTVSFTASNPYWEDLESKSVFVDSRTQAYPIISGDVPVNVELRFIGYGAENPKIVNTATGQFVQYNGTLEGLMKVNTNFGKKTAINEILQTSLIYGGTCRSFANSASVLISVGSVIMVSKNGLDFEILGYTLENELTDVVYADDLNLFVAVGKDIVMTSSDGFSWNKITVPGLAANGPAKIAYSKPLHKFVTIQEETVTGIWTSTNGTNWTHSDAEVSGRSIVYCGFLNKFFAVGRNDIFSSADGTSWVAQSGYSELKDICVNEQQEILMVVTDNTYESIAYYTSTDGINWNSGQWEEVYGFENINVTYSKILGLYIVAGNYFHGRGHFVIKTSFDGSSWTNSFELRDIENKYEYKGNRIFYSKEFNEIMIPTVSEESRTYTRISSFNAESWEVSQNLNFEPNVLVYDSNLNLFFSRGLKSADGIHWVEWTPEFELYPITKLIFSKSLNKLCVVNPGTVEISEDGVTAEKTLFNPFNNFSAILYKPDLNGGIYYLSVLVESTKAIIFFDNENHWEVCYAPEIPLYNSRAAAYSDDLNCFVAVGDYGRIAKVTYSGGTPSVQNFSNDCFDTLTDVIWCDSLQIFIAVGLKGTVAIYDGTSAWIFPQTNVHMDINSLAWSSALNRFVAVGMPAPGFASIIYSSDGINWTPCDPIGDFNDVVWAGNLNLFIAIGPGEMFFSSDGINWTRIQEGLPEYYIDFTSIAWSDSLGMFLVVGYDGSGNAIAGTSSGIDGWQFTVISNVQGFHNVKWSDELNKFLVVAGSKIYETIDGVNFSVFYYDPNVNFYEGDIATGGTDVLVVADYGVKIFSNDEGVNWTNISTEITESPINSMSMSDDCTKMVAVGKGPRSAGNSNILINSEGGPHDWTIPENVPQEYIDTNLVSVAWAENLKMFVAVGESGAVLWSSSLNSWNKSTTPIASTINFENVVFCDGLGIFVATGNDTAESESNTVILISVDGRNWNELNSYYGFNSPSIAWSNKLNKFIVLGDNNNMLSSNMTEAENVIDKLNSDSNLDFKLDIGNNMLRYVSDNGIGNVQVTYSQKYIGV